MIPPFDHNNVLPPYQGDNPAIRGCLSPYKSDILEFCQHFGKTPERIAILKGFVEFRTILFEAKDGAYEPLGSEDIMELPRG